jgi:predicted ATPase/DNA-binding SARP family transcriptional activator
MPACEPTAPLTLRFFGSYEARRADAPLPRLRSRTGQWLLALLVLRHEQALARSWLAGLLWPETPETTALANLRRSLLDLRRVLGADAGRLTAPTPRTLRLDLAGASVDVLAFDAALARGDAASLAQAVALYRGALLEDCAEEWVLLERGRREQAYLAALETLAGEALGRDELAQAMGYLRRLVAADPLRESAHRTLMEALAQDGDCAAAVQVYRDLRLLLHREVHADPAPETRALFERIRAKGSGFRHPEGTRGSGGSGVQAFRRSGVQEDTPPAPATSSASQESSPSTLHAQRSTLPHPASSLIGREGDVEAVRARLGAGRLVTLVGPGGVGKTRLALQVAHEVAEHYPDGAWFVDLAPLSEPVLVPQAVALALGLREQPGCPLVETLETFLRERSLLLVLDNCEHLIEAAARLVDALLLAGRRLRVLATSREALRVPGEARWQVPPLPVPPPRLVETADKDRVAALLEYAGVRLFVERVAQVQPGFRLTGERALAAAEICAHLDGLPLALELAAAQVPTLSLPEIAQRVGGFARTDTGGAAPEPGDRFGLLTGGSRTAAPRQQTLRATLDWSYRLLTEPEQAVLRRLSVFAGSFTREAAEAVVSGQWSVVSSPRMGEWESGGMGEGPPTPPLSHSPTLPLLASLVAKSLVIAEAREVAGEEKVRYRLLETVREYGRERLREAGEWEQARERHGTYFLELLQRWEPHLGKAAWFQRVEGEYPNVRLALEWSLSSPAHAALAIAAARSLQNFWLAHGHICEGRAWWGRALQSEGWLPTALRGWGLQLAGVLASPGWDSAAARSLLEEAAALARLTGDTDLLAWTLLALGTLAVEEDDHRAAALLYEESLARARQADQQGCAGWALHGLARVNSGLGHLERATACAEESLALFRELGDTVGIAAGLHIAGRILLNHGGDLARARALFEESLALSRAGGDLAAVAETLTRLGDLVRQEGDLARARTLFEESLALRRERGDRVGVGGSLSELGFVAIDEGDLPAARSRIEESLALRREAGDRVGVARMLFYLGTIERLQERFAAARPLYGEALALGRELRHPWVVPACLLHLGLLELGEGHPAAARQRITEALMLWRDVGDRRDLTRCLGALGRVAVAESPALERAHHAARLFGAAEALEEVSGLPVARWEQAEWERAIGSIRSALGEAEFAAAWAAGRRLTPEEALAFVLVSGE